MKEKSLTITTKHMIEIMNAFVEGKKIQVSDLDCIEWHDCSEPSWNWLYNVYRIKPEPKRMTEIQLAEWCAKGCGLWKHSPSNSGTVYHTYWVIEEKKDCFVGDNIVIRPWGSDDWVEPTVDIYERDCKGDKNNGN